MKKPRKPGTWVRVDSDGNPDHTKALKKRSFKKWPSLSAVIHACIKDAPSGLDARAIADFADKPYPTLMSEASNQPGHKLGADLILPLMDLTDSDQPLHFLARHRGGVFIKLPDPELSGLDESLTRGLADSMKEFSEFAVETAQNISDGDIPKDQLDRIITEGHEAIEAIMVMIKMARQRHEQQYGRRKGNL